MLLSSRMELEVLKLKEVRKTAREHLLQMDNPSEKVSDFTILLLCILTRQWENLVINSLNQ